MKKQNSPKGKTMNLKKNNKINNKKKTLDKEKGKQRKYETFKNRQSYYKKKWLTL